MKTKLMNLDGEIVLKTKTCIVKQNTALENLTLSSIRIQQFESSSWYEDLSHERIYLAVSGFGTIEMNEREYSISPKDIVLVEKGKKHRLNSTFDEDLYLIFISNKEMPDD